MITTTHDIEAILKKAEPICRSVARNITGNYDDAEDVSVLAKLRVVRSYESFQGKDNPGQFVSWVAAITRNLALNFVRDRGKHKHFDIDAEETKEVAAPEKDEYQETLDQMTFSVHRAIDGVLEAEPDNNQMKFIKLRLADIDVADIAREYNIPEGTVKSRVSRGITRIRKLLV